GSGLHAEAVQRSLRRTRRGRQGGSGQPARRSHLRTLSAGPARREGSGFSPAGISCHNSPLGLEVTLVPEKIETCRIVQVTFKPIGHGNLFLENSFKDRFCFDLAEF